MRTITESEFQDRLREALSDHEVHFARWVTGPGRSGAIAAVYASYFLNIPYVQFGYAARPEGAPLVIDITECRKNFRDADRLYGHLSPIKIALFEIKPYQSFWFKDLRRMEGLCREA